MKTITNFYNPRPTGLQEKAILRNITAFVLRHITVPAFLPS